jgi:predicted PurR-regulated permease PerM
MFGIDQRALRVVWTVSVFLAAVTAAYWIRRTIAVFLAALFLAHLLDPIVLWLQHVTPPRIGRTASLMLVYLALIGILAAAAIPVVNRIGEDATVLTSRLPEIAKEDLVTRLPLPSWLESWRTRIASAVTRSIENLDREVVPFLTRAGGRIVTGLSEFLSIILIPILTFFFLKDGPQLREAITASVQGHDRTLVERLLGELYVVLTQYMRALVLLSLATFVMYSLFFIVIGAPYALLLSSIAGVLEFIPVAGPAAAAVAILFLTGFSGFAHVIWIIVFLIVYRVFQDYVLSPFVMGAGVEIHPLLVLFGVLAGQQIAGIPGMFFSIPVMAALRVIVQGLWAERHRAT